MLISFSLLFYSTFFQAVDFLTPSIGLCWTPVVIPPKSNAFSDCRKACHGSKLTNFLGKKITPTFDSHVIRSCTLKPRQVVYASLRQANNFFAVCSIFELGRITKHFNDRPHGNSEFCFPSSSIEGNEETKAMFPLGPVIECLSFCVTGVCRDSDEPACRMCERHEQGRYQVLPIKPVYLVFRSTGF